MPDPFSMTTMLLTSGPTKVAAAGGASLIAQGLLGVPIESIGSQVPAIVALIWIVKHFSDKSAEREARFIAHVENAEIRRENTLRDIDERAGQREQKIIFDIAQVINRNTDALVEFRHANANRSD